jgi:UDP-N-acetylglucosamine 2-epimerase (non-hydrolysing)
MLVFGTRPEAIKLAPLIKEFESSPELFETIVCVTAQHRQMLDEVLEVFSIVPNYDLDIMRENQSLTEVFCRVLQSMMIVIEKAKPDYVIVHGDTSTCFAAALSAFYNKTKVLHVEAGLRTHNISSPFPEEMNRQLVGRIASYHFSPTPQNKSNLLMEGVSEKQILVTGNTIVDALQHINSWLNQSNSPLYNQIQEKLKLILNFDWKLERFVLITAHRRENFGKPLANIFDSIRILASEYPHYKFVFPLHPNPNLQEQALKFLSNIKNVCLIPALDYLSFIELLRYCHFVMTDSGGVQEEAPSFGKRLLLLRTNTERPEGLVNDQATMVGSDQDEILRNVRELLQVDQIDFEGPSEPNPFGDGQASKRIVEFVANLDLTDVKSFC